MRLILASHPDMAMFPGELPLWRGIAPAHARSDLSRAEARQRLIRDLVTHPRMKRAGIALDGDALAAGLAALPAVTLGTVFAHALPQVARQAGKSRWGAKDPRSEFHGDLIFAELPACRMVHMVRDPRDVLASQRAAWGRRAQHIVSTVDAWRRSAGLARRGPAAHGDAYVVVRYEDLVAEPSRVVREICPALGLEYRPEMLDVAGRPLRPATDADDPASATPAAPISRRSVGRHRAELHPGEVRYIEWRARREMAAWGYEADAPPAVGGRPRLARHLSEEGAWRTLRCLHVWALVSRALGRLPPGT
jgi:hypothetical protein